MAGRRGVDKLVLSGQTVGTWFLKAEGSISAAELDSERKSAVECYILFLGARRRPM